MAAICAAAASLAQTTADLAQWSARVEPSDVRAGEQARLLLTARIKPGWHIYKLFQTGGPLATEIALEQNPFVSPSGDPQQPPYSEKFDKGFETQIGYFEGEVTFGLPVKVSKDAKGTISGTAAARWQACDKSGCANPTTTKIPFEFKVAPGKPRADRLSPMLTDVPQTPGYVRPTKAAAATAGDEFAQRLQTAKNQGLASYLLFAFWMGLLALLTPCVFPMVPVTVSFFSKRSGDGVSKNLAGALMYCAGIIATFTIVGLLVTAVFGATGLQALSANPWVNLGLAGLFIVLALSLFGAIQFRLPGSVIQKAQGSTGSAGVAGPLFMGLTFSLTSFTCTVPFVGTILAGAAAGEGVLYPTFGMIAFSLALAIPFFALALFPSLVGSLPKAGAWMNVLKAYMGFLELAFALKFLSNADLALSWGVLTKPVFLAVWGLVFGIAGMYLLGWLRLASEPVSKVGPLRIFFGIATLAACVYSFALINSAPAPKQLIAFVPPAVYPGRHSSDSLPWIDDYEKGKAAARSTGRLMLLNFTGVTCTNCRQMEEGVFTLDSVKKQFEKFVLVELYTDRNTEQDRKNLALRDRLTHSITNPVYVVMTPDEQVIKTLQPVYLNEQEFLEFLQSAEQIAAQK